MMRRVFALLIGLPLMAQAGPADDAIRVEVLPGWRTAEGTHMAALRFDLAPGWKTYWRAPGDGGIPPRFGWQGAQNITGAAFHWPVPQVDRQSGMRTMVYHDQVVIPVEFTLSDPSAPVRLESQIQLGVCHEICVPVMLDIDADLPASTTRDPLIIAALLDQPQSAQAAGVGGVTCALTPMEGGMTLTTQIDMAPLGPGEEVVIETGDQRIWVSEPDTARQGRRLTAQADMIHVTGNAFALDRSGIRITVLSGNRAVDIQGCSAG